MLQRLDLITRCPWYIAGPLLGLIIIALRAALNRPLGATGGYIELTERITAPSKWGLPVFVLIGTVAGGAAYSVATGTWRVGFQHGAHSPLMSEWLLLIAAGFLMGVGARAAGGCTSGHGLCGTSSGSPASFVATITFFATAVLLSNAIAWLGGTL